MTITLVKSPYGRKPNQGKTLKALGLNKVGDTKTFNQVNDALLGQINTVKHLLKVEE